MDFCVVSYYFGCVPMFQSNVLPPSPGLKAMCSSEILANDQSPKGHKKPEDRRYTHRRENIRS
jgi:hypothetical protein